MNVLAIWTVYDNPTDYPGKFVARRYDVNAAGANPSTSVIVRDDLDTLRAVLGFKMRLTRLIRSPEDEPHIVETWW